MKQCEYQNASPIHGIYKMSPIQVITTWQQPNKELTHNFRIINPTSQPLRNQAIKRILKVV